MSDVKEHLRRVFASRIEDARLVNARLRTLNATPEPEERDKPYALFVDGKVEDVLSPGNTNNWFSMKHQYADYWDSAIVNAMSDTGAETLTVVPLSIP